MPWQAYQLHAGPAPPNQRLSDDQPAFPSSTPVAGPARSPMSMPYRTQPLGKPSPTNGPMHGGFPAAMLPRTSHAGGPVPTTPFSFSRKPLQHSSERALLHSRAQHVEPSDGLHPHPALPPNSPQPLAAGLGGQVFPQSTGATPFSFSQRAPQSSERGLRIRPPQYGSSRDQVSGSIGPTSQPCLQSWLHHGQQQHEPGSEDTPSPPGTPSFPPRIPRQQQQLQTNLQNTSHWPDSGSQGFTPPDGPAAGLIRKRMYDESGAQPHMPAVAGIRGHGQTGLGGQSATGQGGPVRLGREQAANSSLAAPQLARGNDGRQRQPDAFKPMVVPAQLSLQNRLGAGGLFMLDRGGF